MSARSPDSAGFVPRIRCAGCDRPASVCLCEHVQKIATRTRVVILQHPRESGVPIGTARLAELVLTNCERHVGVRLADAPRIRQRLGDRDAPAILLFPGPAATPLESNPPLGPKTLLVLDGTWWQAEKLLKQNPELERLPRYRLAEALPSRYRIRREPAVDCLSTIEAIASALAVLEDDRTLPARILPVFDALVETQLRHASEFRVRRHVARCRPDRPHRAGRLTEHALHLVAAYGEANAWPRGTPLGSEPEIVHWAAERVATGERFEAFIRPQKPVAPSFGHHTGLDPALLERGLTWNEFQHAWAEFLRPEDMLCGWGYFGSELLRKAGALIPSRCDVRDAARRFLRKKPGQIELAAALLGVDDCVPWVLGRTGQRLAALTEIVRVLSAPEP